MKLEPLDETSLDELKAWPDAKRIERLEKAQERTLIERRRITALQRSQMRGVIACVLLVVVTGVFVYKHLNANTSNIRTLQTNQAQTQGAINSHNATAQRGIERAQQITTETQISSCKRSNQSRVTDNRTTKTDHDFFVVTARLIRSALSSSPPPADPGAAARLIATLGFISQLEAFAANLEWRPLTENCEEAVSNPKTYKLSAPYRYSERAPGPEALRVQTGKGLDE